MDYHGVEISMAGCVKERVRDPNLMPFFFFFFFLFNQMLILFLAEAQGCSDKYKNSM